MSFCNESHPKRMFDIDLILMYDCFQGKWRY